MACRAGVDPVAIEYIAEIDKPQRSDAQLADAAHKVPTLSVLDVLLLQGYPTLRGGWPP